MPWFIMAISSEGELKVARDGRNNQKSYEHGGGASRLGPGDKRYKYADRQRGKLPATVTFFHPNRSVCGDCDTRAIGEKLSKRIHWILVCSFVLRRLVDPLTWRRRGDAYTLAH
jgi:hypothetical protein